MTFEVIQVSRGNIRLKSDDKQVRALGEALIASTPADPSYVVYLNSIDNWETPAGVALTETEKHDVITAIRKYFHGRGSVIDLE